MPMSGNTPRVVSFRNTFLSADSAADAIRQQTGSHLQLVGNNKSDFHLGIDVRADSNISCVDTATRHGGNATYSTIRDAIGIKTALRGKETLLSRSGDVDLVPGTGLVYGIDRIVGYRTSERALTRTLVINKAMFDTIVAAHFGAGNVIPIEKIISFSLMHRLGQIINLGANLFSENFSTHPDCVYSAVSTRLIREALAVTIAEIYFLKSNQDEKLLAREITTSREQVRKALDIIKTQDRPLSIHDIAATLGVGVRALQISFKKHIGTPPHFLLRQGRLEGAKRDIEARAPQTVKEVAAKWGFSNVGRFSGEYLRAFGESPYDAIRRTRTG